MRKSQKIRARESLRGVDVVRVRNALITHSFVASKNLAEAEDNAGQAELGRSKRSSSSLEKLQRLSSSKQQDPVDPHLKAVLQALMLLLRPVEHCKLLTGLDIANAGVSSRRTSEVEEGPKLMKKASSLPEMTGQSQRFERPEYYLALVSNRQRGVEEDAIFILKAMKKNPKKTVRRIASLMKMPRGSNASHASDRSGSSVSRKVSHPTGSHAKGSHGKKSSTKETPKQRSKFPTLVLKETGSFVADSIRMEPESSVDISVIKAMPIWSDLRITLQGRGFVRLSSAGDSIRIGTVSIRSMWRVTNALTKARTLAKSHNFFPQGPSHQWISIYQDALEDDDASEEGDMLFRSKSQSRRASEDGGNFLSEDGDGVTTINLDEEDEEDTEDASSISVNTAISGDDGEGSKSGAAQPATRGSFTTKIGNKKMMSDEELLRTEAKVVGEIQRIITECVNLDDLTTQDVITELELIFGQAVMANFKRSFIDEQIILLYGQQEPPSEIIKGLFLGTEYNAANYEELLDLGITHILNVTKEIQDFFPDYFEYKRVNVKDQESVNLGKFFDEAVTFIAKALDEDKAVLVHCQRGVSRSASCVIAYLIKTRKMKYKEAFAFAKERRPVIKPNSGFVKQLQAYEKSLNLL